MSPGNRAGWSPQEKSEYDAILAEVVVATSNTTERLDLFADKIADAVQAHRGWARRLQSACAREGYASEIKRYQDRNRVMVSHEGKVLNLPSVQGTRRVDDAGQVWEVRELIELWTWEEIRAKREEALTMRSRYDGKVGHYDRLLELHARVPDSQTPHEAAENLGTSVAAWLGDEATA